MDASGKYLAHIGSDGSTAEQRIKAAGYKAGWYDNGSGSLSYPRQENVAYGQDTAEEVVEGWMNSPGHRAAILAKDAKEIGVGLEIDNVQEMPTGFKHLAIPYRLEASLIFNFQNH